MIHIVVLIALVVFGLYILKFLFEHPIVLLAIMLGGCAAVLSAIGSHP